MTISDRFGKLIYDSQTENRACDHITLEAVDLSLARLPNGSFVGADLYWVTFFDADLSVSNFSNATLRGVDLKDADCRCANFSGARFLPDSLGLPCELQGANLIEAILEGVEFICTTYDSRTKWPAAFDPSQHGGLRKVNTSRRS